MGLFKNARRENLWIDSGVQSTSTQSSSQEDILYLLRPESGKTTQFNNKIGSRCVRDNQLGKVTAYSPKPSDLKKLFNDVSRKKCNFIFNSDYQIREALIF